MNYKKSRQYRLSRQKNVGTSVFDRILGKKTVDKSMMILFQFTDKEKIPQEEMLKKIFGRIESDPYRLICQKIMMSGLVSKVREDYGIYIRNFYSNEPYYKMLTTKEEFETLAEMIQDRIDNLESKKNNVREIINDFDGYKKRMREILETIKVRGQYA